MNPFWRVLLFLLGLLFLLPILFSVALAVPFISIPGLLISIIAFIVSINLLRRQYMPVYGPGLIAGGILTAVFVVPTVFLTLLGAIEADGTTVFDMFLIFGVSFIGYYCMTLCFAPQPPVKKD